LVKKKRSDKCFRHFTKPTFNINALLSILFQILRFMAEHPEMAIMSGKS